MNLMVHRQLNEFTRGKRVRYLTDYPDPRRIYTGVVSSTNDRFVFVKFDNAVMRMTTGDEPYTSEACNPEDLELINV